MARGVLVERLDHLARCGAAAGVGWTRRALSAVRNYVKDVPRLSLRPDIVVTHGPPVAPLYNPAEEPF